MHIKKEKDKEKKREITKRLRWTLKTKEIDKDRVIVGESERVRELGF